MDKRGFFVFEPEVLNFIDGDSTVLESTPLSKLTKKEILLHLNMKVFGNAWIQ